MDAVRRVEISEREAEVLAAVGEHRSNQQIANRLHISVRTVESHVSSLLRKFGVADRRALADLTAARPDGLPPGRLVGLPASRTTFVGRERERAGVVAALTDARLVSLLGPGGMGKTRLAAVVAESVAAEYPAGGAFVDLVPVRDGFVAHAVADALGVTERPPQPLVDAVAERLRNARALLVLDNCEHLVDEASGLVERLLSTCPAVTVVATSRERLGVPGERAFRVPPLSLGSDAERLFLDRARAVDPDFGPDPAVVSELCTRLDGMPLAIELAAARAASLGVDGLRTALDDRLRLLSGGRGTDERHRSLRAVISWSYDLLDADERALFNRLAVFVGGFDLDAAAAINPGVRRSMVADLVGRLVDKSLVVHRRNRWRMLETIRVFAADELTAAGEEDKARHLHLRWAARTAADLEAGVDPDTLMDAAQDDPSGPIDGERGRAAAYGAAPEAEAADSTNGLIEPEWRRTAPTDSVWRAEFEEVADDLRAAAAATSPVPDATAHQLARSLGHLMFVRRSFVEARGHYQAAAKRAGDGAVAAADLRSAAHAAIAVSDGQIAFDLLLEAAERAHSAGAENVRATALAGAVIVVHRFGTGFPVAIPPDRTAALLAEASAAADPENHWVAAVLAAARAWESGEEKSDADPGLAAAAVEAARRAGDPVLVIAALDTLGVAAANRGRMREAYRIATERLRIIDGLPRLTRWLAIEMIDAHYVAAVHAVCAGDLPAALAIGDLADADDPTGDHPYLGLQVIQALALSGRFAEAVERATVMWDGWLRDGSPLKEWLSSHAAPAAMACGLRGDLEGFDLWMSRARQIARVDDPSRSRMLAAFAAFVEARVALHIGQYDSAATLVDRAFADFPRRWYENYARATGAELAVVAGLPDAADRIREAGPFAEENDWAAACLARATGRLHGDPAAFTEAVSGFERIGARFERACTLLLLPDRAAEGRAELDLLGCPPPAR